MENLYIIIFMVCALIVVTLYTLKLRTKELEDARGDAPENVMEEMRHLLKAVDVCADTEEEHLARYQDLRRKYKDTLTALGYDFPKYKSRI